MEKRQELYRGKAKTVYATDDPGLHGHAFPGRHQRIRRRQGFPARTEGRDQQSDQCLHHGQARRGRCGDPFRSFAQRARFAGRRVENDSRRMRRPKRLRRVDGQALRHRRGHALARADFRVLLQERRVARSAGQRRSHSRAGLGKRRAKSPR